MSTFAFPPALDRILKPGVVLDLCASTGWHRLPGGRLEYRDTGFYILHRQDVQTPPYYLVDPDGRTLMWSFLLQPLKQAGEQGAADRAEILS